MYTYHGDHAEGAFLGPLAQVLEWFGDGPEPIEAEDEEVEYGRRAGRVIHADPELAESDPEDPVAGEYVDRADRHDDQTDCEVRDCQAHDEHVAYLECGNISNVNEHVK